MALKKLSTNKKIAKSSRLARGKKKITKKAVKKTKKKLIKKMPVAKKKPAAKKKEGNLIGTVTHYFPHVQAAVIKLKGPLAMGDTVKIKGHTTDLTQAVTSMQIDRVVISNAKKGDEIGLQVNSRVRQGDKTYKL
ncbi:MAG: hypothetical protein PHG87_02340 [Candidatus Omnitrophica bacterium]|nr:hypothetical protein [Candidatus Omnitrophota bacterium]